MSQYPFGATRASKRPRATKRVRSARLLIKPALLIVAIGSSVALLAACSTNGLSGSPPALSSTIQVQTQSGLSGFARPGIALPFPSNPHVAIPARQVTKDGLAELNVADRGFNEVLEFNKSYKSMGTISDSGPDGDWIDAKDNLYVTNFSRGNVTVNEYNKADKLIFTYTDRLTEPIDVTTDTKGNVIVANFVGYHGHVGTVVVYPQGKNTASVTCNTGLANEGVAVDSKGDVFVTGYSASSGEIIEYKGGLTSPCSATTLAPTLSAPTGIQVDKEDDLVVCDQHAGVDIIPTPYASISKTITVAGGSDYFHDALTGDNKLLFIADPNAGVVDVVDYPSGTLVKQLNSSNGLSSPFGVATYPFAK